MAPRSTHLGILCLSLACWAGVHPRASTAQRISCDGDRSALIQTVQDGATRVPVVGAVISASWQEAGEQNVRAVTDSAGRALICAPPGHTITLRSTFMNHRLPMQTALLSPARSTHQTLNADLPSVYLRGSVIDRETGAALPNVGVRIVNTPLVTATDNNGRFFFEQVPLGDYILNVETISYAKIASQIAVRTEDLDITVRLVPEAIPLAPVVVTGFSRRLERAGFYERQKRGVGNFLGRAQIESMNVQSASDLLRRVPSARLSTQMARSRAPNSRNNTTGRGNCRYKFLIDGSRTLPDFEMDQVSSGSIEGVEIYNGLSEVPAIFRGVATAESAATCGVIAIWTRDGH